MSILNTAIYRHYRSYTCTVKQINTTVIGLQMQSTTNTTHKFIQIIKYNIKRFIHSSRSSAFRRSSSNDTYDQRMQINTQWARSPVHSNRYSQRRSHAHALQKNSLNFRVCVCVRACVCVCVTQTQKDHKLHAGRSGRVLSASDCGVVIIIIIILKTAVYP